MGRRAKEGFEDKYVTLGGLIINETDKCWVVLVGRDRIFIPKSASKLKEDDMTEWLVVSESLLKNEKGIKPGVFDNRTEEDRDRARTRRKRVEE
jgi:hypothetical protein